MTYPSGLLRDEAETVAHQYGVALDQVHRDHLISSILAALQAHADDLIFFGGTALARTYLPAGRLSEDIDLIAVTDRRSLARAISRTIERALRVTHGRVNWTVALADIRDTEPASLVTADGLMVRVQLVSAQGYPPWPTAVHAIGQRYSDIPPTRLRTPVRDSFAAWKATAWFERHAPRDLYDLWALALVGALTASAAQLFATHTGLGLPQDPHVYQCTGHKGLAGAAIRPNAPNGQCRGSPAGRPHGLVDRPILTPRVPQASAGTLARHVDFLRRTITVEETIVEVSRKVSPTGKRFLVKHYPKDNESRVVGVRPQLISVLSRQIERLGLGRDDLLFPSAETAGGTR